MKSIKVNNFLSFFLWRFLGILLICGLTFLITGQIADMRLLVFDCEFDCSTDYGARTLSAIKIFSFLQNIFLTRILLVFFLAGISSSILYLLCKSFVDKINFKNWALLLISPCLLIYTNVPTKEIIFFYPAVIYIILECKFLISESRNNLKTFLNIILKFTILPFIFFWRGYLAAPYLFLAILSIFLKNFRIGEISKKINLKNYIILSFIFSTILIAFLNLLNSDLFEEYMIYLYQALDSGNSLYRSNLDYYFMSDPLNSIYIQYLSLFPTIDELIDKPYQFIIVIESITLIYVFFNSWKNLFETIKTSKKAKKITLVLFGFIIISYFTIYGFIGSFNAGSSQRFRVNYIPIGIFFPLILEKNIRDKFELKSRSIKSE